MKLWFQDNNTEMYLTNNERKSFLAERFVGTLKNKIYRRMTSISKMFSLINQMTPLINTTVHIIEPLQ